VDNFEAIVKSLVWRFLIAIPISLIVCYVYTGSMTVALEMTIVANVISTILYYLFDIIWFRRISNYFRNRDVEKT
jgi:uncharacterized membrane protein